MTGAYYSKSNFRDRNIGRELGNRYRTINLSKTMQTNKMTWASAKTQISLGIQPVWLESSLFAWINLGSSASCWARSEDSDQIGRMSRLTWVFAVRTYHFVSFVELRLNYYSLVKNLNIHIVGQDWIIRSDIDSLSLHFVWHWCNLLAVRTHKVWQ